MTQPRKTIDIAVVGTGPAGLAAALAVAKTGLHVALVGPGFTPKGRHQDRRTAALFAGSVEFLRNLDLWPQCEAASAPISAIRMIDGRQALLRAPEVVFQARDAGRPEFGFNVPNQVLTTALWRKVAETKSITVCETSDVTALEIAAPDAKPAEAVLHLGDAASDGKISACLVVAADGRHSLCREAAGIKHQSWSYPQTAIACAFEHDRPHGGISTEFHLEHGPVTVVPMPGNASSLVWVTNPATADTLMSAHEPAFLERLEHILGGLLGPLSNLSQRAAFPLSALAPETCAANGVVLVGEAAHVIPPIGAQGLNLGLRDGAVLADCIARSLSQDRPAADLQTLQSYNDARLFDIRSRTNVVDLLNRSLLTDLVPAHLLRGAGLHMLKAFAPLRRWVVKEGLEPSSVSPSLMRPDGCQKLQNLMRRAAEPSDEKGRNSSGSGAVTHNYQPARP